MTNAEASTGPGRAVEKCTRCAADYSAFDSACPACRLPLLPPNVRWAGTEAEMSALHERFELCCAQRTTKDAIDAWAIATSILESDLGVVVAMSADFAKGFLLNRKTMYINYEALVDSGARRAAAFDDDVARRSIATTFFGGIASKIIYGALTTGYIGLRNYGSVFARLKEVAVKDRVSFLESNTFDFVHRMPGKVGAPELKPGYRAIWSNRHELAAVKIESSIEQPCSSASLASQLLISGKTRADDSFIEAHIFEAFNADAVANIAFDAPEHLETFDSVIISALRDRLPSGMVIGT